MRVTRGVVVGIVAAALLLTGCTSTPQAAGTLPSTTRTAAASSSGLAPLGPADFRVPAEARVETADGATAFIKYYIELMSRAQRNTNSEGLRDLAANCTRCSSFADGLDEYGHKGYVTKGGGLKIDGLGTPALRSGSANFSLSLSQMPSEIHVSETDSTLIDTRRAGTYAASGAIVRWDATIASWLIEDLTIQGAA